MNGYTRPDFTRCALITIDLQNDFVGTDAPAGIPGTQAVVPNVVRALQCFRQLRRPIVHVVRLYCDDGSNADLCRREAIEGGLRVVSPGSDGAELVDVLKPDPADRLDAEWLLAGEAQRLSDYEYVMYKPRWGAFFRTSLAAFLQEWGCNTVAFVGCNFPNCPRTSIYEASERDLRVILLTDAVSQLYPQGEAELGKIGVNLLTTAALVQAVEEVLA